MEAINELATALNEFQAEVVTVRKDASNPFFKSKYAPLDEIMKSALPVLTKHGLAITQLIDNINGESALTTRLVHKSGQSISSTMPLLLTKNDPQGQGSAITYARRYSYAAILGIVIDEDDDGNSATRLVTKPSVIKQTESKTVTTAQGKLLLARARDFSGKEDWEEIKNWFVEIVGKEPAQVLMKDMDATLAVLEEAREA